jgi:hypothetical protein
MNSLIVAHVRPRNAYGITRAIEKDKEKKKAEAFYVVLQF